MTRFYYVQKKAENLKLGDMYVDWAFPKSGVYGDPARILDIKEKGGRIEVKLDNLRKKVFLPGFLVIVEVMA
jgi:hypothetical protein